MSALVAGLAVAAAAVVAFAPDGVAAVAAVTCTAPAWAEGNTYQVGTQVTDNGHLYQALVTHTAYVGAGWNPAATPSLWTDLGTCSGSPTTAPTTAPTTTAPTTSPTTTPPTTSPTTKPTGSTCGLKSRPAGKVLQGYWENWDGSANGVHPGFGWVPINDGRLLQHGYDVIAAAFPVIRSDGTAGWRVGAAGGGQSGRHGVDVVGGAAADAPGRRARRRPAVGRRWRRPET